MLGQALLLFSLLSVYVAGSRLNIHTSKSTRATGVPLSFENAQWIWTGEEISPGGNAPVGSRGFRFNITDLSSARPACVTLAVAADNLYILYVNGIQVGDNLRKLNLTSSFHEADVHSVALNADGPNILALIAVNVNHGLVPSSPAAVIATGLVQYSDGNDVALATNSSWKTFKAIPPVGFQDPAFDDASWTDASHQGTNGVLPWSTTTILPFSGTECA